MLLAEEVLSLPGNPSSFQGLSRELSHPAHHVLYQLTSLRGEEGRMKGSPSLGERDNSIGFCTGICYIMQFPFLLFFFFLFSLWGQERFFFSF